MLVSSSDALTAIVGASVDPALLQQGLSWASSAVESYCEREFAYVAGDVRAVNPYGDRTALLPNPPVLNIATAQAWMGGQGGMAWRPLPNYQWTEDGLVYDTTGLPGVAHARPSWPRFPKSLRFTYDHGFQTIPQPILDEVTRLAAFYIVNAGNLVERKVGDITRRWTANGRTAALDDAVLGRYRLTGVGF